MGSISILFCLGVVLGCVRSKEDPCDTCTNLVKSFNEGLEKTAGANFGGGNSDWEETRLGSFATSETRLVEILDSVCERNSHSCNTMLEEKEEVLEEWWFKEQQNNKNLQIWFCENKIEVCCPKNTYGPKCKECPGGVEKPCSERGSCLGEGKRSGSGRCSCDQGYQGDICDTCVEGYFKNELEDGNCTKCHYSCALTCHGPGKLGCDKCKAGWNMTEEEGCQDIDECEIESPCEGGKYCINTVGSYRCENCDAACADNCTGAGPESCQSCAHGYIRPENSTTCEDVNECAENATLCEKGTYCDNVPGTYECKVCDPACGTACLGEGSQGCIDCAAGYQINGTSGCEDIDECQSSPCTDENEECINSPGSYECNCKPDYNREDGTCVPIPEEEEDDEPTENSNADENDPTPSPNDTHTDSAHDEL
ncbi:cysteine-rich with EGF-like domain protein 2 [Oscarella lobularis]|uniref:cysteine-rich with EGF-like domain protein 2 n=1 Tax=Oscarella lobularis TaxID=121494 RepID=UPI003313446A